MQVKSLAQTIAILSAMEQMECRYVEFMGNAWWIDRKAKGFVARRVVDFGYESNGHYHESAEVVAEWIVR